MTWERALQYLKRAEMLCTSEEKSTMLGEWQDFDKEAADQAKHPSQFGWHTSCTPTYHSRHGLIMTSACMTNDRYTITLQVHKIRHIRMTLFYSEVHHLSFPYTLQQILNNSTWAMWESTAIQPKRLDSCTCTTLHVELSSNSAWNQLQNYIFWLRVIKSDSIIKKTVNILRDIQRRTQWYRKWIKAS